MLMRLLLSLKFLALVPHIITSKLVCDEENDDSDYASVENIIICSKSFVGPIGLCARLVEILHDYWVIEPYQKFNDEE